MTRKRTKMARCKLCGSTAHVAECVLSARNRTLYAVVCDRQSCRLSEVPPSRMCLKTEEEAVEKWNGDAS